MARILVVDDDPDFQTMLAMVLESAGHEVDMAFDGRRALARMREQRPELVILDVMMTTDTEGFAVARAIRAEPSLAALPIIMLTSIHEEKKLTFRLAPDPTWLPVDRFLDKPVKPALLLAAVTEALAGIRLDRDKGDAQ
jgi:two-component system alkaline phosphatase synthesis response regulator PhoP